jgi:hypothetical protein
MQNTAPRKPKAADVELIRETVKTWTPDVKAMLVRVSNVYTNRFRVDVFTKLYVDHGFVPRTQIAASFFVALVDGTVVDLTIEPKESN